MGGQRYFGKIPIDGTFEAVDAVKDAAGGVATVFLEDLRVSANVIKPDTDVRATP